MQSGCSLGVISSKKLLLPDGKGALVQWFCLAILALLIVDNGQMVQSACSVGMISSELLLVNGKGTLVQ